MACTLQTKLTYVNDIIQVNANAEEIKLLKLGTPRRRYCKFHLPLPNNWWDILFSEDREANYPQHLFKTKCIFNPQHACAREL